MATRYGAAGFWSYTHADDEADGGRIQRLAKLLKDEFGIQTGAELDLFVDREALRWGEQWRERIEQELAQVTFFIPLITPRYFESAECRRELLRFSGYARSLGAEQLLMPILYADVPGLQDDEPADEAVALVKRMQRVDWRDLRLCDEASSDHRRAVAGLATRLREIAEKPPSPPEPPEPAGPRPPDAGTPRAGAGAGMPATGAGPAEKPEDPGEEPGYIELLAEGEAALPRLVTTIEAMQPAMEKLTRVTTEATERMQQPDVQRRGYAGVLRVTKQFARDLADPARRILELGHAYVAELVQVDPAILTMLRFAEEDPTTFRETSGDFFVGLRQLGETSTESVRVLGELASIIEQNERFSSDLRPPLRSVREGLQGFLDGQAVIDEWVRRAREIESAA